MRELEDVAQELFAVTFEDGRMECDVLVSRYKAVFFEKATLESYRVKLACHFM